MKLRTVIAWAVAASGLVAVPTAADPPAEPPAEPEAAAPVERVVPLTDHARFDPLPAMWGVEPIDAATGLGTLDESLVLFVSERARFETGGHAGLICFAGGRHLVTAVPLDATRIAGVLESFSCLAALEYESPGTRDAVDVPAGVYRLARAPRVTLAPNPSGPVRVELEFAREGQAQAEAGVILRRLVFWSSNDATIAPLAAALPPFARLGRKVIEGFADPPRDARPLDEAAIVTGDRRAHEFLVLADRYLDMERRVPLRLDRESLRGTAEPGLFTLLGELGSGKRRTIDGSFYFSITSDPCSRGIDRRLGVFARDPAYWP